MAEYEYNEQPAPSAPQTYEYAQAQPPPGPPPSQQQGNGYVEGNEYGQSSELAEAEPQYGGIEQPQQNGIGDTGGATAAIDSGEDAYVPAEINDDDGADKPGENGPGYFGNRRRRMITFNFVLLFYSFLAFPRWFDTEDFSKKSDANDWYNLCAAGLFFIFLASLVEIILIVLAWKDIFQENNLVNMGMMGTFNLGGFLYFVGGCVGAGYINDFQDKDNSDDLNSRIGAYAGIVFFEAVWIMLVSIVVGVDVWRNFLSKGIRIRTYLTYLGIFLFESLFLFFLYAAIDDGDDANTVAGGYFFTLIGITLLAIIEFVGLCCKCIPAAGLIVEARKALFNIIANGVLILGAFLVFAGMWACGDYTKKDARKGNFLGASDEDSEDNMNAYFVGYGFFVLLYALIISLDTVFGEMIEKKFDGGGSENNDSGGYDDPAPEYQ